MGNDIRLNDWEIECESEKWNDDFHESIFFTGNGRLGMRGYLPHAADERPLKAGMFCAGIFEEIKDGITDIVHLPTAASEKAYENGRPLKIGKVYRSLNLKHGLFAANYSLEGADGKLDVKHQRFACLDNTGLILQRTVYTAPKDMSIEIQSGISLASRNSPIPDDQVKTNDEIICLFATEKPLFNENSLALRLHTAKTALSVKAECYFYTEGLEKSENLFSEGKSAAMLYKANMKAGQDYVIEKLCFISTSRDKDPAIKPPGTEWRFETMLKSHVREWEKRWKAIALPALPQKFETASRYIAAQLVMNGPSGDNTVSIGARGLSHSRYKGCYFWDTDMFLLPFYQHSHPETAKNLVEYRINNLPAAKKHARLTSAKGARYPWMASFDGSEQCESWDIGLAEIHITADVVYSIHRYITDNKDDALYPAAAEVYIETARFWADRITIDEKGNANLLFVKGPDEYCGITNNNLFTNTMVRHNLSLARKAASWLEENMADKYKQLGLNKKEAELWAELEEKLPVARNPESGRLQQDDTFHLLQPVDIQTLKSGSAASYRKVAFDRLQRYKVIKQADLILLMTRMPNAFSEEEKKLAWQEYEPLCLHDSTLSFASHALFAAQNGYSEAAENYLEKALFLDLSDIMDNTGGEGLHLACYGEAWQALMCMYTNSSEKSIQSIFRKHSQ